MNLLFLCFQPEIPFWTNLVHKIKIVYWSWNLEPRLIRICRIRWGFSIFPFPDWKYYFRLNKLVQKFKIVILSWNLVPGLLRICKIRWWCSLFLLYPFFCKFYSKNLLAFWCYLINLPAVYWQRLEASDSSCFTYKAVLHHFFLSFILSH